ncbi:hypothetical protein C5167_041630 [Papaver somniferum]|nr:hypothetical protein C5167_041630 [Papaver somniferum]
MTYVEEAGYTHYNLGKTFEKPVTTYTSAWHLRSLTDVPGPNLVVYRLPRKLCLSLFLHKRFYVQLQAHRLQLHKPFYVQLRAHRLQQSGFVQEPGGMVGKTAAIKTKTGGLDLVANSLWFGWFQASQFWCIGNQEFWVYVAYDEYRERNDPLPICIADDDDPNEYLVYEEPTDDAAEAGRLTLAVFTLRLYTGQNPVDNIKDAGSLNSNTTYM